MREVRPKVAPYTFAKAVGPPSKDPINLAFIDMLDGFDRVERIMRSLGFQFSWGVGDQYFAAPDRDAPFRRRQDANLATALVGWRGRDHVRLFSLPAQKGEPYVIVGAVHRERWPEYFPFVHKPCDAVESFDAPRNSVRDALTGRFSVGTIDFGNRNPFGQCSGQWPASDGLMLIIEEPGVDQADVDDDRSVAGVLWDEGG